MSILDDLFNGKIHPYFNINEYDADFKPINQQIKVEKEDWLKKRLSEEEYERFEKLESLYYESMDLWQKKSFKYGFRLGALLMIAIFSDSDDLFRGME